MMAQLLLAYATIAVAYGMAAGLVCRHVHLPKAVAA